jgi:ATP adenylyltransferase
VIENYLWTPWRMQYIASASGDKDKVSPRPEAAQKEGGQPDGDSGCVFCDRITLPPERDRENLILLRGERNFIILNLYPYNSGHLMVVPYEHTSDFTTLNTETVGEMMALMKRMVRVMEAEYGPQGFNMGMNLGRVAGAGVADHVHMHLVPRWAGDTNFMPIVGQTKVMPEMLETTYDRLRARLDVVD